MKLPKGDLHFEAMSKVEKSILDPIEGIWNGAHIDVRDAPGELTRLRSITEQYLRNASDELAPRFGTQMVKLGFMAPELWPLVDAVHNSVGSTLADLSWLRAANFGLLDIKNIGYPPVCFLLHLGAMAAGYLTTKDDIILHHLVSSYTRVCQERLFANSFRARNGSVFVVSPQLLYALLPKNTSLGGVLSNDIRLPHRMIYFDLRMLPEPLGTGKYSKDIDGCYITEETKPQRRWLLFTLSGIEPLEVFEILWQDESLCEKSLLRSVDAVESRTEKLLEQLREHPDTANSEALDIYTSEIEVKSRKDYSNTLKVLFGLLMNLVLYITHPNADAIMYSASKEYRKLERRILKARGKKLGRLERQRDALENRVLVGFNEPRIIDRKVTKLPPTKPEEEGTKWSVRSLTRGHWRKQACGQNLEERKLIWIKPHWKGPEDAPVNYKKFLVQ